MHVRSSWRPSLAVSPPLHIRRRSGLIQGHQHLQCSGPLLGLHLYQYKHGYRSPHTNNIINQSSRHHSIFLSTESRPTWLLHHSHPLSNGRNLQIRYMWLHQEFRKYSRLNRPSRPSSYNRLNRPSLLSQPSRPSRLDSRNHLSQSCPRFRPTTHHILRPTARLYPHKLLRSKYPLLGPGPGGHIPSYHTRLSRCHSLFVVLREVAPNGNRSSRRLLRRDLPSAMCRALLSSH